jgi:recombination protein RecA
MNNANKEFGPATVVEGDSLKRDPPRIPFGVFSVDFAIGGGVPVWGSLCLWGPESGGKSSLACNVMSMAEKICWKCFNLLSYCDCSAKSLPLKALWADVEGTLDREWAHCIGADPKNYLYTLCDYGEMYINVAEKALQADDCGIVIVDSLAALTPTAEFEAPSEDQFIGAQARMISRAVRKLKQRVIRERKREHPCTLLFTNQMRTKIGTMFGNPETMPGGHALKHEFSVMVRCVQKTLSENDKKKFQGNSKNTNRVTRHAFSVKKEKVLTLANAGEFVRVRENMKGLKLEKGMIDDYNTTLLFAKNYQVVEKKGKSWVCFGEKFSTLVSLMDHWQKNIEEYHKAQREVVSKAKERLEAG